MQLAEHKEKIKTDTVATLNEAYKMITSPQGEEKVLSAAEAEKKILEFLGRLGLDSMEDEKKKLHTEADRVFAIADNESIPAEERFKTLQEFLGYCEDLQSKVIEFNFRCRREEAKAFKDLKGGK
jgi:superfamily I DNA/RNA helicase